MSAPRTPSDAPGDAPEPAAPVDPRLTDAARAPCTVVLGDEHDAALRAAVAQALKRLNATTQAGGWQLAGAQEIETLTATVQGETLMLEAETYVGLSATGPTWLVQRLQAFVRDAGPSAPSPSAAGAAAPSTAARARHVIVGLRPAQALPTADGGLEVRVYDWASGEMVPDPSWLSVVLGQTDKDVDEVTEAELAAHLARLRAQRASG